MHDMLNAVGPEYMTGPHGYNLTDYSDNLVVAAEDLCEIIEIDIFKLKRASIAKTEGADA